MDLPEIIVSADRMQIRIGPGVNQYGTLAGLVSLGLGAAYYGSDYFVVKCMYVVACLTLGISFLDNWEECIFDKSARKATFRQFSFYQRFLKFQKLREININLQEIVSVLVNTIKVKENLPACHTVTLLLRSGVSMPLLEALKSKSRSDCELVAEKTRRFLNISHMELLSNHTGFENFRYHYGGDTSTDAESEVEDLISSELIKETETSVSELKQDN